METFKNCYCLKSVVLTESILSIEGDVLKNYALLLKIRLPNSVKSIHATAFEGCILLQFENCIVINSIVKNGGVDLYNAPK